MLCTKKGAHITILEIYMYIGERRGRRDGYVCSNVSVNTQKLHLTALLRHHFNTIYNLPPHEYIIVYNVIYALRCYLALNIALVFNLPSFCTIYTV